MNVGSWPKADVQNRGLNVRFGEDSPVSRNGSSVCREAPESALRILEAAFSGEAYSSVTIGTQSFLDVWIDRGERLCLSLGPGALALSMMFFALGS